MAKWKRKRTTRQNPYKEDENDSAHGGKSEKRVLEDMGANPTLGSGAFPGMKSDGTMEVGDVRLRIECKSTVHKSMRLEHAWLKKIRREALETGRIPVLTVSFVKPDGEAKIAGDWVMIPDYLWNQICNND